MSLLRLADDGCMYDAEVDALNSFFVRDQIANFENVVKTYSKMSKKSLLRTVGVLFGHAAARVVLPLSFISRGFVVATFNGVGRLSAFLPRQP